MKTPRILALSIASLLLTSFELRAVTDTWDGGGANNSFSTDANWADNTAPLSDLANTDIVFAGTTNLNPFVGALFSLDSIVFNNTAGAFTIFGAGFNVGAGGIRNNDTQRMTFDNSVSFSSVASSTINASLGGLTFDAFMNLPANTLTVTGGFATSFKGMNGPNTATLHKQGAGTMTWDPLSNSMPFDVTISGGTLTLVGLGVSRNFAASSTIAVNAGAFDMDEHVTLFGGQLTRAAGAIVTLAAGKTLNVLAGSDVIFTGAFANNTASTIDIEGAGSTLSTTGALSLSGGSTTNALDGGSISAGAQPVSIFSNAALNVDGNGSSLSAGSLSIGSGTRATLNFRNSSSGAITGALTVDGAILAFLDAELNIDSGATVSAGSLLVAHNGFGRFGSVLITGAGSALTLSGTATIGGASSSAATVNVENGGTFTTGTGLTTVNATGDLNINAGGTLTGAADFSGTGRVTIAGAFLPGTASGVNQTTSVSFAQNMTFQPTTSITMELGGLAPGTQHDQVVFNGPGSPHVTWNGTLNLVLINGFTPQAGHTFDVFDFDAVRDAGTFSAINLPVLPAGLAFNSDELYTSGLISVVSTGGTTFAQWAAAELGDPGALPGGNHDGDAYDNLTEYALALHPPFPGAAAPSGGFHVYPEGERMRVLFWRHIDRTDITIRVQASTDIVTWNELAVSVNSAPFTGAGFVSENRAHPLSEPGIVEVRDVLNAGGEARRYLRILLTRSP